MRAVRAPSPALLLACVRGACAQEHATTPGSLEGRPDRRARVAAAGAHRRRAARRPRGGRRPAPIAATCSSTSRCSSSGEGRPRLEGSGSGSVVRDPGRRRDHRGLRHRRAGRRRPGPRHVGHPRRRAAGHDPRLPHHARAVRRLPPRGAGLGGRRHRRSQGMPGLEPGEKGSGIHVWNTDGFRLTGNRIVRRARRPLHPVVAARARGRATWRSDVRYGLHYMFSDDNVFEDNVFEHAAAGHRARCTRTGSSSAATGSCTTAASPRSACSSRPATTSLAEDNLIADNARGIFLEGVEPQRLPAQRRGRVRHGHRAVRLVRGHPVRGQLVRRRTSRR